MEVRRSTLAQLQARQVRKDFAHEYGEICEQNLYVYLHLLFPLTVVKYSKCSLVNVLWPMTTSDLTDGPNEITAGIGGAGLVGAAAMSASFDASRRAYAEEPHGHAHHFMPTVVGEVDHAKNGFDPTEILSDFDPGRVSKLPNGQTLHEYTIIAQNTVAEVVPGLKFAAWTRSHPRADDSRAPGRSSADKVPQHRRS